MIDNNPQPTESKPASRIKGIHKNKKAMRVINICLIVVWVALAYGLIYKPIVGGDRATKKVADNVTIDSANKVLSQTDLSQSMNPEGTVIDSDTQNTAYGDLLAQNRAINFPFYDKLPYENNNFFIDFPLDSGALQIFVKGETSKQLALDWLKANGSDLAALDIQWTVK